MLKIFKKCFSKARSLLRSSSSPSKNIIQKPDGTAVLAIPATTAAEPVVSAKNHSALYASAIEEVLRKRALFNKIVEEHLRRLSEARHQASIKNAVIIPGVTTIQDPLDDDKQLELGKDQCHHAGRAPKYSCKINAQEEMRTYHLTSVKERIQIYELYLQKRSSPYLPARDVNRAQLCKV